MFNIRFNSQDENIYNEIYVDNSYKIGNIKDFIVIDVGCHRGTFVKLAVENGAKFVDGYELFPESYKGCLSNTENYDNVRINNKAVWRSDIKTDFISISNAKMYSMINERYILDTGGETLMSIPKDKNVIDVPTIAFDDILEENYSKFGKVDLVKMDCEGSEYPILYTSKKLEYVKNIVLEYHYYSSEFREEFLVKDRSFYNENSLGKYLEEQGFMIYIDEHQYMDKDIYHGNMFAIRDENHPFLINYLLRSDKNGFN